MDPARTNVSAVDATRTGADWRHDARLRALARRRHEPSGARRWRACAWLTALALHLAVVICLRVVLRPPLPSAPSDVLVVDLIDVPPSPPLPTPPLRAPPLPHQHPAPRLRAPPGAAPAVEPQPIEPPPLRVFNPDGSARVPDDLAERIERERPQPDFIPRAVEPSPILQVRRPLKVRPNHFAQYWSGTDGKPLHETMWRYVSASKEFEVPWGGHWRCGWILILVACSDVPAQPWSPPQPWRPATVLDER